MRTSINITNFAWPQLGRIPDELAAVVEVADQGGIDTVFVSDHLLQAHPALDPDDAMLEVYTTLGFLAARTRRVRLGAMVSPAALRPPALLIKAVTTLDVLSDGRAWLGIGAGYHQREATDLGLPLPPTRERFEWLDDTLQLTHRLWHGDTAPYTGQQVTAQRPVGNPRPVTQPHPPILIGGSGETRTLPLVARYADACNLPDLPDGGHALRHKLSVLAGHCRAVGRAPGDIEITVSTRLHPDESAAEFAARAPALAALGVDHLVVITDGPWTARSVAVLADAATMLADLDPTHPTHTTEDLLEGAPR